MCRIILTNQEDYFTFVTLEKVKLIASQQAFYVNLHRAVIGMSATLTGRSRPDIDLRRMLTGMVPGYALSGRFAILCEPRHEKMCFWDKCKQ